MNVVAPGSCWDSHGNGVYGDQDFDNLFSILDFPIESLEENEFVEEDWDISKSQSLGPIPPDVLMDPLIETDLPCLSAVPAASVDGAPELTQVPEYIHETSASDNFQHCSTQLEIPESRIFQSPSPNSVLESSGCSNRKGSPKARGLIPVKARSKRVRAAVNPWLALLSPLVTAATSSSVSSAKRERHQRKKTMISHQPVAKESKNGTLPKADNSLLVALEKDQPAVATKKCAHCEVTKTPQWREGPTGPKTLCNACGVRYRSGRLFPEYRPAASPTFTPALHSNSHKKVIEMRSKASHRIASFNINGPAVSPRPEFAQKCSFLFEY